MLIPEYPDRVFSGGDKLEGDVQDVLDLDVLLAGDNDLYGLWILGLDVSDDQRAPRSPQSRLLRVRRDREWIPLDLLRIRLHKCLRSDAETHIPSFPKIARRLHEANQNMEPMIPFPGRMDCFPGWDPGRAAP